ncbi:SnoaL-like domain-containing protein [Mycena albidolilacea]|uniref:SnoaL-like domain-containing protein n=1 Tax=Mycena albidolilacea TaxID=1033008 RepID=A0AAD6ZHC5_9AGAR|nr:SnoaL-like domain-containing protein [Mycena albidolilacea]
MASYTVSDYLLDRINIEDTITKLLWYVDRQNWDAVSALFAEEVVIDYTSMLGGEPVHTNGADQVKVWKGMLEYLDSTQHVASGILVDLPQPTVDKPVQRPMKANFTCNVSAHLVRYAARGGPIIHNAGNYAIKFVRSSPDSMGHPWLVSAFKANIGFISGNTDVVKNPETKVGWL